MKGKPTRIAPYAHAFSGRLRQIRNEVGFTQKELAKMSGVHRLYISRLERGVDKPGLNTLLNIADSLDVSLDYLTGRSNDDW